MTVSKKENRRKFLRTSLGLGIGATTFLAIKTRDGEKVVLISKDGKLYEVPESVMKRRDIRRLISQDDLDNWIKSSDHGGKG